MGLVRTTGSNEEPVALADVKEHLRVDVSDDDLYITGLISAARGYAETYTRRRFIRSTYELTCDFFPPFLIELPRPPLSTVSNIGYIDTAGSTQTFSSTAYLIDTTNEPGRLTPNHGDVWPATLDRINAVTITFKGGYSTNADDVPIQAKQAIMMICADLYRIRETVVVGAVPNEVPLAANRLLDTITFGSYP